MAATAESSQPDEQVIVGARLADMYADRHERLDQFIVMYAIPGRLFGRLGIELHTARGYLLLGVTSFVVILLPALAVAALTSSWSRTHAVQAVLVSAALAALNVLALVWAQAAAYRISAMHRALTDERQVRSLMEWDRRWYSPVMSAVMGGAIAVVFLAILYYATLLVSGIHLSSTILWFCAVVTLFLGQYSFSTVMIFVEFRKFARSTFSLYSLSPIDTRALQETSAGLKQLGIVSVVMFPLFYLVLLTVLPRDSNLNVPLTGAFLLLSYLATAIGTLFPLKFLGNIVKSEKWRVLEPMQARLNELLPRAPTLADPEYEEFRRLKSVHDSIAASDDSFLSFGVVARIVGAVGASTLTVVATAVIQSYVSGLL